MSADQKRGKHREIAVRYLWVERQNRRRQVVTPRNAKMAAIRAAELTRLFCGRYGPHLPDDDAGNPDIELMLHHLAHLRRPEPRMRQWIERCAPWMPMARAAALIGRIVLKPHAWTADELGRRLNLTAEERHHLKITTIGAVDMPKKQRATRRRKLKRLAEANRRRAKGAKRRIEYDASAKTRTKPWEAAGMSRRTWYRWHKRQSGTGPCPA